VFELARLIRRSLHRPLTLIVVALLLAVSAGSFAYVKKLVYSPKFVLRAVETDNNVVTAPRPKRKLRDYVQDAVFTHTRLLDLIKRHGLYPSLTRKNPRAAVESFREDIEVEVYRNYFVEERTVHEPPRSARIAIRYKSEDSRKALAVTRDLGRMIIDNETSAGKGRAAAARSVAAAEVEKASADLIELRQAIAAATRRWAGGGTGAEDEAHATIAMVQLNAQLVAVQRRMDEAERRKAQVDLSAALEQQDMGLRFEVVDDGAVVDAPFQRRSRAMVMALLTFFFGLPFVAVALGAFDARIRTIDDIERLRLNNLGEVRMRRSSLRRATNAGKRQSEGHPVGPSWTVDPTVAPFTKVPGPSADDLVRGMA
jgi:hypothetical protein